MDIIKTILPLIVIGLLIYIFINKMEKLESEFSKLINIVGSLKFKQFQHENQLLDRSGVYVPEDSAEFVYKIIWSTVSEEQKDFLENEYKDKCPPHIPMWKFVLYNYKLTTNIVRKEPISKMSSVENLIYNNYEMEETIEVFSKKVEEFDKSIAKTQDTLEKMTSTVSDTQENNE